MRERVGCASPWSWIPSLYFAEGLPYAIVTVVSVVLYRRLGISNAAIALYTSWLYLPWVIKPIWSPVVEQLATRRTWIVVTELLIGAGLGGVALTLPMGAFFQYSLACLWLVAFSSATHDIAADGFYMLGLTSHDQAWFVGIRSTCYRLALIAAQGGLIVLAGSLEAASLPATVGRQVPVAWSLTFLLAAASATLLGVWHARVLPAPPGDHGHAVARGTLLRSLGRPLATFFKKKHLGVTVAFLLLFRFSEAQLVRLVPPFLLDAPAVGGLGLDTATVGFVYGTLGAMMLLGGGVLGGMLVAKHGLSAWLTAMVAALNLPNVVYLGLSWALPDDRLVIALAVGVEQFGYGFGFTAFTLYLIYVSQGQHRTAHYAIGTGFMALGMMLPGMPAGWLQETLGYQGFFGWAMVATIPSFAVARLVRIDSEFGKDAGEPDDRR